MSDSAEPSWAETSVRWLFTKGKSIPASFRSLSYPQQLGGYLTKINYFDHSSDLGPKERQAFDQEAALRWGRKDHTDFVAVIESWISGKKSVSTHLEIRTPFGIEVIKLDVKDPSRSSRSKQKSPASVLEQEKLTALDDLDEIVAQQVLQTDPRYGAW